MVENDPVNLVDPDGRQIFPTGPSMHYNPPYKPHNPPLGGTAGYDVMADVSATLADIERTFNRWDEETKCASCREIHTFPNMIEAWDIDELKTKSIGGGTGTGALSNNIAIPGENTATFGSGVFAQYTINWIMFGKISRLCRNHYPQSRWYSLSNTLFLASGYKGLQSAMDFTGKETYSADGVPVDHEGTLSMVRAGYNGSHPSRGRITGLTKNTRGAGLGVMTWHWKPGKP
jgi:hypothetical protein